MVNQSKPDSSELQRGRPLVIEAAWYWLGQPFVRWRWLPWSHPRELVLKLFGATIGKGVRFHSGLRVKFPWYLTIGDDCWVGESVWVDNLARVTLGSRVYLAAGVYLCTGNHDWSSTNMRLFCRPISIEDGAAIEAKAVVCPGVIVGKGATLSAGSVASRDIPEGENQAGNPAALVRTQIANQSVLTRVR